MDPSLDELSHVLLREAPLYTWKQLELNKSEPPARPGVYAWYFDKAPGAVQLAGCFERDGVYLLYVGISPGREPSRENLRSRIRYHFRGNAEGSTLRLTLGCLLEDELSTVLRRVGSGRRRTFHLREESLSGWIAEHARVSWVVTDHPKDLETRLIDTLCLPLNLDHNKNNAFHRTLSELRASAKKRALACPISK